MSESKSRRGGGKKVVPEGKSIVGSARNDPAKDNGRNNCTSRAKGSGAKGRSTGNDRTRLFPAFFFYFSFTTLWFFFYFSLRRFFSSAAVHLLCMREIREKKFSNWSFELWLCVPLCKHGFEIVQFFFAFELGSCAKRMITFKLDINCVSLILVHFSDLCNTFATRSYPNIGKTNRFF